MHKSLKFNKWYFIKVLQYYTNVFFFFLNMDDSYSWEMSNHKYYNVKQHASIHTEYQQYITIIYIQKWTWKKTDSCTMTRKANKGQYSAEKVTDEKETEGPYSRNVDSI